MERSRTIFRRLDVHVGYNQKINGALSGATFPPMNEAPQKVGEVTSCVRGQEMGQTPVISFRDELEELHFINPKSEESKIDEEKGIQKEHSFKNGGW